MFSNVNTLVEKLTNKSYALNFLRTSLYRINEVAFNGDISEQTYKELYTLIITETSKIQQKELGVNEIQEEDTVKNENE